MTVADSQRVAIVTGASRGIGRATAKRLAQDFSAVAIVARSAEGLESLTKELAAQGKKALPVPMDLNNRPQQPKLSQQRWAHLVALMPWSTLLARLSKPTCSK